MPFRHSLVRPKTTFKRKLLIFIGLLFLVALVGGGITVAVILRNLPNPDYLFSRRIVQSTKIFDRSGSVLLYEIHGEEKRTIVSFVEIPAAVKNAVVAAEDAKFYSHRGIDFRGILRALLTDITTGDFRQGGSTITQQLVKNSLLGSERTLSRKLREAVLAIAIESRLDKDKILDLYLNQIPYGQNAYGIEAAAETYFGKHASALTVGEAALLSSLPRAPSYYSPYGQHKDDLFRRKDLIIERMRELGYLTADEAEQAKKEQFKFLPASKNIRAPHFVMFVRDYLIERYGEDEVEKGGLIVTTTLDWKLQEQAEKIAKDYAEKNEKLIKAKNMALVAINPKSGDILAMVGSRDFFDIENDGNYNVATALRQPGSAFKPFVYATAFKKGFTPKTVLFDVPTEFNPLCDPYGRPKPDKNVSAKDCYHPQNYDEKFRGPVTVRQALGQSLNVPSVKLLYLAGVEDSIRTAEALGINSLGARARFGLSLVLGGAEVRLLEMTSAYGVFANEGVLNPPTAILKIETTDRRILEEKNDSPRPVLDAEIARTINDVLSDNEARIPTFIPHSSLYFANRDVAAKTGTTQEYHDAWTIGYTPSIVVGTWAGNNDNTPMQQKGSGVLAAAPAWHEFMASAIKDMPPEEFPKPTVNDEIKPVLKGIWQGDTVLTIDSVSQKLATDLTPPETRKDVAYGEPHDPLFWIDRRDPLGPPLKNPEDDPQYANWLAAFDAWLKQSAFVPQPLSSAPKDYDDVHTVEKQPKVNVNKSTNPDGSIVLDVTIQAPLTLKEVVLSAGERIIDARRNPSPIIRFFIAREKVAAFSPAVEIYAYDIAGNIGQTTVPLP